jgi:hypothetical protein
MTKFIVLETKVSTRLVHNTTIGVDGDPVCHTSSHLALQKWAFSKRSSAEKFCLNVPYLNYMSSPI